MNADAPTAKLTTPPLPRGLRTLWEEAGGWVAWLLGMFDRDALRTTGISRQRGARLGVWLMGIESAVRRILLAAALAFTPPALRRPASAPRDRTQPAAQACASFTLFRLNTGEHAPRAGAPTRANPRPYGHLVFPGDPLLRLGATPRHTLRTGRLPRARNPLDRHVRLSRHDPDWRAPEEVEGREPGENFRTEYDTWIIRPQAAPRLPRTPHTPETLAPSLPDWRRRHDEWMKIIPAPGLAARLDALARIAANPAAAIARAARRLQHAQGLAIRLARQALPPLRPPRRAAHIETAGHTFDIAERSHAALVVPDTS